LAENSVSSTLNLVAATFRENGRDNPKRDAECNIAQVLQWQLSLYKKENPKGRQQKALPVCVLLLVLSSKVTEL
jgi:hypothetical protein